jgi:hypothetical protein
MSTISTVKKLAASGAMAGVLGLATLGLGSGLAAAAPATHVGAGPTAAPGTNTSTSNKVEPTQHEVFPHAPANPHLGQGHKGWNEPVVHIGIRDTFTSGKDSTMTTSSPSTTGDKSGPAKHELFPVQHGDV